MGANSLLRKVTKRLLYPLTNEKTYKYLQAASKSWDIKKGSWSEPELDLVKLGLREGETALDIGANFGLYSNAMSRAVGKTGKIYAFEPIPFTYSTLVLVAKLLGFSRNVELVNKGCSNENGKITFSLPTQESGAASTGQAYIGVRNDDHAGKEQQVRWVGVREIEAEVVRLDDFLPEIEELSFIKADIEGAELFCFRGAEKLIRKHLPVVVCEINPWFLEGFGVTLKELTDFFFDLGYKMYFYEGENGAQRLREIPVNEVVEDNYVFLHPSRGERFSSVLK